MKLTVPDAARRVGRSPETIRRWIWSGRLPSEKVGNQHLVDVEALDALAGRRARVGGEWGDWLRRAEALGKELRSQDLPPAAELVRASRRGVLSVVVDASALLDAAVNRGRRGWEIAERLG